MSKRQFVKSVKKPEGNTTVMKEYYKKFFEKALTDSELLELGKAIGVEGHHVAVIGPRVCPVTPSGIFPAGEKIEGLKNVNDGILGLLVVGVGDPKRLNLLGKRVFINPNTPIISSIPLHGVVPDSRHYFIQLHSIHNVLCTIDDFSIIAGEEKDESELRL